MQWDLSGKTALVTGASQGIGKATVERLASSHANVILVSRSEEKLDKVRKQLKGSNHQIITADLSSDDDVKKLLVELPRQVDIYVNNSGGPPSGALLEADPNIFSHYFHQHVISPHRILQKITPNMKSRGYGRIINVISTSVKIPINGLGASNTIRGAVASYSKTLANEVGRYGITVNNILPGFTDTPRLRSIIKARANKSSSSLKEIEEQMKSTVPAGRFAVPEETAAAIAFLCSDEASYIHGINLPVDGGRTGCL